MAAEFAQLEKDYGREGVARIRLLVEYAQAKQTLKQAEQWKKLIQQLLETGKITSGEAEDLMAEYEDEWDHALAFIRERNGGPKHSIREFVEAFYGAKRVD
ncbi:hypothetical protein [Limnochorda pilosa]|uniref:Uncharacterized protein n=1 Tax=Limnochorda pilosa TaxID=1555112 RepID=A0A0K2SM75_LIMPI|nr:hypothetical protein [Limnochorda pilosa]BAS28117.1 hypothetical protein LIP_2276 [Limnochorda pilosa]